MLSLTTVPFFEMSQCPHLNMYAELQICTTRIHKLLSDKVNHSQYESRHTHSVGGRRSTRLSQRLYRVFAKNKSRRRRSDKVGKTTKEHKTNTSLYTVYDVVRARAHACVRAGARFVDVRQTFEWRDGHIAGSVHRPVDELVSDPRLTVTADALIVTYCAAGARAARAAG